MDTDKPADIYDTLESAHEPGHAHRWATSMLTNEPVGHCDCGMTVADAEAEHEHLFFG